MSPFLCDRNDGLRSALCLIAVCALALWAVAAVGAGNRFGDDSPYLSRLSIFPPGIKEGQSATGTVTLSAPAPTGGLTISLECEQPSALSVPATIVVPANRSSATFTIKAKSKSGDPNGNIFMVSAKNGKWIQGAYVTVTSADRRLSVDAPEVTVGDGRLLIDWDALPPASVKGFHVYRDGATQPLNATPLKSSAYCDEGLTNGQAHTYRIGVVDWNDKELLSPPATATPAPGAGSLAWAGKPELKGAYATFTIRPVGLGHHELRLWIDGGGGVFVDRSPNGGTDYSLYCHVDTSYLPNGTHTAQVVGTLNGQAVATPLLRFRLANPISEASHSAILSPGTGGLARLSAKISGDRTPWTVTVTRENPLTNVVTEVRRWEGIGPLVSVAWDGTKESGRRVGGGTYRMEVRTGEAGAQAVFGGSIFHQAPPGD